MSTIQMDISDAITEDILMYSAETIKGRAIPWLTDGMKPGQRRLLYTMNKMKLFNKLSKCANITGRNMELSPHSSAYGTLVGMTKQYEGDLVPFIDGKGSFGKIYSTDTQPAAERYTEAQLMPICHYMFDTLYKHPDNFKPNYDDSTQEPIFLSMPFPTILSNSTSGQAVAFACSFGSWNLNELCDVTEEIIKGNDNYNDLISIMPGPDFTTGATMQIEDGELENIFMNGRGRVRLRAKFENDEENRVLKIVEIPYNSRCETIIKAIRSAYDKGQFPEIEDVTDTIDISGFSISIDYAKDTDVNKLIDKLYALTPCQSFFNFYQYVVHEESLLLLGVIDIIKLWIEERAKYIQEEIDYDINDISSQLHILQGLSKVLLDIDKAVKIVRESKTDKLTIENLMNGFDIDKIQAEQVANIKLRNFNEDYILSKTNEIEVLSKQLKELENTNPKDIMITQLHEVKELYGQDRKTELLDGFDETISVASLNKQAKEELHDGKSILFIDNTRIKRVNEKSSAQTPDGMERYEVDNFDEVLIFTSLGRVFKHHVYKIAQNKLINITDLIKLQPGELVLYATPLIPSRDIIIVFDNKRVARITEEVYVTKGNKKCFKQGFSIKHNALYITSISEDTILEVPTIGQINTKKYLTKKSKTSQGVKL